MAVRRSSAADPPPPAPGRSLLLPARARHARPRAGRTSPAATWLLAGLGVVLLAAAALVGVGPGHPRHVASAVGPPPPGEHPVELEIPALDVAVAVKPVGLTGDQHMEVPAFGESGWYHPGPRPGQPGHAVIAGHVDSRKGPDVFYGLHTLRPGDEVLVRMSTGSVIAFSVDEVERQPKEALPESPMWSSSGRPQLALLTCGGRFDRKRHTYPDNVVVYASMA